MTAGALLGLALPLAPTSAPPASAAPGSPCAEVSADDPGEPSTDPSAPLAELQIPDAHRRVAELSGRAPGEGVAVAVVGAGIRGQAGIPSTATRRIAPFSRTGEVVSFETTAVAGLIAGARRQGQVVGVAPDAAILDVRVYDTEVDRNDDLATPTAAGVAAGLRSIVGMVGPRGVRVVVVPVQISGSRELGRAVRAVTAAGALVVVPSGDRAVLGAEYLPGEDAGTDVFPAAYSTANRRVIAVSTSVSDDVNAADVVVMSSAIDVAAPSAGAVSYGLAGRTCLLPLPSTVAASGVVAGVIALLWTVFPTETPDQIATRLIRTATGSSSSGGVTADRLVGHGVVQPLEALTRTLRPRRAVDAPEAPPQRDATPVALPEVEPDRLRSIRENAVWWGLVGGGVLVTAVVVRPVFARRRSSGD
ncbi:S8 family serine peptidase [Nocardioides sp. R-C-SC26]|uniref:S8 family serine peptidase n=1 Tax=Nocardioides sp. R-C-SC26 TaxID=2870414 RepID=UPI001E359B4A|nr:S8 family serine peptidase [Nocardioides sp. R-C-SC26]